METRLAGSASSEFVESVGSDETMVDTASEDTTGSTMCPPIRGEAYMPPPEKAATTASANESAERGQKRYTKLEMNGHVQNIDDVNACIGSSSGFVSSKKRGTNGTDGPESLAAVLRKGMVDHQLGVSLNLLVLLGLAYFLFPSLRPTLFSFMGLSYRVNLDPQHSSIGADKATSTLYGEGSKDAQLILTFIVLLTAFRAFMLDYVLTPFASQLGIKRTKQKIRFAEQSYMLLYYSVYWVWGVWLFVGATPEALPAADGHISSIERLLISLWTGFPRLYLHAGLKIYYLSQLAFWAQQILVVHLEERRKDHMQMLTHHIVTVALLSTSYGYRQWRVGNAVLVVMDIVDLILPLAKILRYLGLRKLCDAAFALFVVVWLVARHGAYLTICWSIYAHVNSATMQYGTYSLLAPNNALSGAQISPHGGDEAWSNIFQPFLQPDAPTVSFNARIRWSFLGLLLGLQCITLMWFVMICRVVARVVRGDGADDSRSDDEGEDIQELADDENEPGPAQPSVPFSSTSDKKLFIEVEASSAEMVYPPRRNGSGSGNKRKGRGISSGLNLGERKEILNRIGCLSDEQLAREREKRDGSG